MIHIWIILLIVPNGLIKQLLNLAFNFMKAVIKKAIKQLLRWIEDLFR